MGLAGEDDYSIESGDWMPERGDPSGHLARTYSPFGRAFKEAERAHGALDESAYASGDDASNALSDQAMEYMRQRGQGAPPGAEAARNAALTSPYAAYRGARGANLGQQLAGELTTTGRQGAQGAGNAFGIESETQRGRLGALEDYGQAAAMRRRGSQRLAEFNATQQGDTTSRLYNALYQAALGQDQRDQAKSSQDAQTGMQVGLGALGLLTALL